MVEKDIVISCERKCICKKLARKVWSCVLSLCKGNESGKNDVSCSFYHQQKQYRTIGLSLRGWDSYDCNARFLKFTAGCFIEIP
jgi:hypothetical protein